jgi:sigma-B regulation protein RsbU (phosphoserine phosphatase)
MEGRFLPCQALGGDFYFTLQNSDGSLAFALSDIVGHGVAAALVAGMLRSAVDAARRRNPAPEAVLAELARGLDFFEPSSYATLVYGQLFDDGRLRHFNAGHPPLFLQKKGRAVEEVLATGLILSPLLPRRDDEVQPIAMNRGDRLLVVSDGVYEARDPAGNELGRPRLAAALEEAARLNVPAALDHLLKSVRHHSAGRPLLDDATLLLIERG